MAANRLIQITAGSILITIDAIPDPAPAKETDLEKTRTELLQLNSLFQVVMGQQTTGDPAKDNAINLGSISQLWDQFQLVKAAAGI